MAAFEPIGVEAVIKGLGTFTSGLSSMQKSVDGMAGQSKKASGDVTLLGVAIASGLGAAVGGAVISGISKLASGALNVGKNAVGAAAELQNMTIALEGLAAKEAVSTGQADNLQEAMKNIGPVAEDLLGKIRDISVISPFEYEDVVKTFRLNMAFGATSDTALGLTSAILDMAAAMGLSGAHLERIAYNFGQMNTVGKVTMRDVRDLALAGVDLTAVLKDQLGMSIEEVNSALASSKITMEDVSTAFIQYANENFGGASARMSQTFTGLQSSLKDLFFFASADLLTPALEQVTYKMQEMFVGVNEFVQSGAVKEIGADLGDMAGALMSIPPEVLMTAAELAGLGVATIGVTQAMATLSPMMAALPAVLSQAVVGFQLYQGGASLAQVATLGLNAALIPLAAGFAALVAVLYAANKAIALNNQVTKETAEVSGEWNAWLKEQVTTQTSATAIAEAYGQKQTELNGYLEEGGLAADLLIDKEKVLNATAEDLSQAVLDASSSYADYIDAANQVNNANVVTVERYEYIGRAARKVSETIQQDLVPALSEGEYMLLKTGRASEIEAKSLEEMAASSEEAANAAGAVALNVANLQQEVDGADEVIGRLTGSLGGFSNAAEASDAVERQLNVTLGTTDAMLYAQDDALKLLALAFDQGRLTQEQFAAAGLQVLQITDTSAVGYEQLRSVVDTATGGMVNLSGATEELPAKLQAAALAADQLATSQEEMAAQAQKAWESFAGSVATGVEQAVTAYQSGNETMLAEQQAYIAELLWNQTNTMLAMGQITTDQAMLMQSALASQYGVMVNDSQLATDQILLMFSDWAAGGATTSEEIVGFLGNIGQKATEMGDQQAAAIDTQLTKFEELRNAAATTSESLGSSINGAISKMDALEGGTVRSVSNQTAQWAGLGTTAATAANGQALSADTQITKWAELDAAVLADSTNINTSQAAIITKATELQTTTQTAATDEIAQWTALSESVATNSQSITASIDSVSEGMNSMQSRTTSAASGMTSAIATMSATVIEDLDEVLGFVNKLAKAIDKLPDEKIIRIIVKYSGPEGFNFGSPDFIFYHAYEHLLDLVENNPVPITVTETGTTEAALADVSSAASTSAQVAAQITATSAAVQAPPIMHNATINMGGQTINNGMDVAALQIMIRQAVAQAL
jgi:tape measure domain-containing protein